MKELNTQTNLQDTIECLLLITTMLNYTMLNTQSKFIDVSIWNEIK